MAAYLPKDKQAHALRCLVKGMSVSAAARIAENTKVTALWLLAEAGKVALVHLDRVMKDLPCQRIEIDELWAFSYAKEYNLPKIKNPPPYAGEVSCTVLMITTAIARAIARHGIICPKNSIQKSF